LVYKMRFDSAAGVWNLDPEGVGADGSRWHWVTGMIRMHASTPRCMGSYHMV
jgi:hypothetical protein